MAFENLVISESEHNEILQSSSEQIIKYLRYLNVLDKLFLEVGRTIPFPCNTNFRDALFHYKKLYESKDFIKISQEKYALEEHLIRLIKDAIISFFHSYLFALDAICKKLGSVNWTLVEKNSKYVDIIFNWDINSLWGEELFEELEKHNKLEVFPVVSAYIFSCNIDKSIFEKDIKKCIHTIKNYCDGIRLQGTEIYRPISNAEYLEQCVEFYHEMIDFLEKYRLKNMLFYVAKGVEEAISI